MVDVLVPIYISEEAFQVERALIFMCSVYIHVVDQVLTVEQKLAWGTFRYFVGNSLNDIAKY